MGSELNHRIEIRIDDELFIRLRPITEPWSEPKVQFEEWVDFEVEINLGTFTGVLAWPIELLSSELMEFKTSLEATFLSGHGMARLYAAEDEIELRLTLAEDGSVGVAGYIQWQDEAVRLSFELESRKEMFNDLPRQLSEVVALYPYRSETKAEAKRSKRFPPFAPRR